MDELAGLYIKLVAKDEGASEAIAEIDGWLKKAGHTAEELQKSLSVFGGNAKTMFLAAAGAADRYAASMADLQAAKVPLEVHMELAGKLADKWHGASRVASELQSKMGLLSQRGGGDVSAYYADEMSRLQFKQGQADRAHGLGYIDTPQYMERTAGIQAEMNALLQQASTKTDQYGQAQAFLASETARANAMVANEVTTVERLNAELVQLRQYQAMGVGDQTLIARGISGREAQLAGGDQALEDKRLQSRRDYYRWLSSEGNAAEAGNVSEQRKSNMETMNTLALLERLKPAEEQHANRIRQYTQELQRGAITQEQFNRLQNHSVMQMNAQRAGGGKGSGQMAVQGSYALQDAVTVAAMGGSPQMAMMSAANNLSQMAIVSGKLTPGIASLIAAVATVGVAFVDWEAIIQLIIIQMGDMSQSIADFTAASNANIASGMKRNLTEWSARDEAASLGLQGKTDDLVKKRDNAGERARALEMEQAALFTAQRQKFNQHSQEAKQMMDNEGVIARGVRTAAGVTDQQQQAAFFKQAQERDKEYQQMVDRSKAVQDEILGAKNAGRIYDAAIMPSSQRAAIASMAEQRAEGGNTARSLEEQLRRTGDKSSLAREIDDSTSKYMTALAEQYGHAGFGRTTADDIREGKEKAYLDTQKGRIDEEIARLDRAGRPSNQMMGFSQFGQSFQMNLLDPNKEAREQRKKQIEHLEAIRKKLESGSNGGVYGP